MHDLNDVAGGHIEGRKQSRRAMALVIVGERAGAPALQREAWLRAIQGLDLTLLIKREDDRPLGRLQVQPDDIPKFFHEGRVGGQLEGPDPMGAQLMGLPDARNRGVMQARHLGHQPCTPMGAAPRRRRRLCRTVHDGFFLGQGNTFRASRPWAIGPERRKPAGFIPIQPKCNGRARDADVTTNGRARVPRGRPEHDAGALDQALGGRAGSDQRFEARAVPAAQWQNTNG